MREHSRPRQQWPQQQRQRCAPRRQWCWLPTAGLPHARAWQRRLQRWGPRLRMQRRSCSARRPRPGSTCSACPCRAQRLRGPAERGFLLWPPTPMRRSPMHPMCCWYTRMIWSQPQVWISMPQGLLLPQGSVQRAARGPPHPPSQLASSPQDPQHPPLSPRRLRPCSTRPRPLPQAGLHPLQAVWGLCWTRSSTTLWNPSVPGQPTACGRCSTRSSCQARLQRLSQLVPLRPSPAPACHALPQRTGHPRFTQQQQQQPALASRLSPLLPSRPAHLGALLQRSQHQQVLWMAWPPSLPGPLLQVARCLVAKPQEQQRQQKRW